MFTVATLCAQLGLAVPLQGAEVPLAAIKTLAEAGPTDLSFLDNTAYKTTAQNTKAAAVLVRAAEASLLPPSAVPIICPQPYVAYARALQLFYPVAPVIGGISQFAVVSSSATIDATARIEPYAVIYAGAVVAAGAHIGAHAVVGAGVMVGPHTKIGAHVTLQKCTLGADCIIHSGVRIGQDGFGFAQQGAELIKIPHLGRVTVGNDVEIGANSTIDAGALSDTVIEDGAKLDKQVQIAHNVQVGRGVRIAGQSGIAGSTSIGAYTVIGGQVGIAGHLKIAEKCMVAAKSAVTKSIETSGSVVAGIPAVPIAQWRQQMASLALAAKRVAKGVKLAPAASMASVAPITNSPAAIPNTASAPMAAATASAPAPKTPLPLGPDSANPFVAEDFV